MFVYQISLTRLLPFTIKIMQTISYGRANHFILGGKELNMHKLKGVSVTVLNTYMNLIIPLIHSYCNSLNQIPSFCQIPSFWELRVGTKEYLLRRKTISKIDRQHFFFGLIKRISVFFFFFFFLL